ncbi:unnamed protein product [Adineta ricciae]|uniref:Cytochrome-b5 reductase n=1 Tax=Adineta ricciae TaxID=249248 RepID=A0A813TP53_ADIRI|nr:unnamed protein product [Adineta ricciae]
MSLTELPDVALLKIFRTFDQIELVNFYQNFLSSKRLRNLIHHNPCLWTRIHIKSTVDYNQFTCFTRLLTANAATIRQLVIDELDIICRKILLENGFSLKKCLQIEELTIHDEHIGNSLHSTKFCSATLKILRLTNDQINFTEVSSSNQLSTLHLTMHSTDILKSRLQSLTNLHLKIMFDYDHRSHEIFSRLPTCSLHTFTLKFLLVNNHSTFPNEFHQYVNSCHYLHTLELSYLHGMCPFPLHHTLDYPKYRRLILMNISHLNQTEEFITLHQCVLPSVYFQLNSTSNLNRHSSCIQQTYWHTNQLLSLDYIQCVTTSVELLNEYNITWSDKNGKSQSFESYFLRSIYNIPHVIASLRKLIITKFELSLDGLVTLMTNLSLLTDLIISDGKIDQMGSGICDLKRILDTQMVTAQSNVKTVIMNNIHMSRRTIVKFSFLTRQLASLTLHNVNVLDRTLQSDFLAFLKQIAQQTSQFRWSHLQFLTLDYRTNDDSPSLISIPSTQVLCCIKPREPNSTTNNRTTMNFLQLPGKTAAATNKPRAQVALAPQHGLMDWIRKMNNTPNISGTNGKLLTVTEEELAKHNKKTDCWTAISGNVYNITPYLDYHPGGVDEIMKGAGVDATTLFQEIHSWVNFGSMLEKCLVGRLVTKHGPTEGALAKKKSLPLRLRFDFRQPDSKSLTLFIYTTCLTLTVEKIFVNIENGKNLTALIFIDGFVHTVSIELLELVTNDFNVRISSNKQGQIEIDLKKQTDQMWKSVGKFAPNHLSVCPMQDFEPIYFNATLIKRTPVTHDSDWYTFSLPSNVFMLPPIGYHIRLQRTNDGVIITKPYTVVNKLDEENKSSSEHTIELLIKHYIDRTMTPMLQQLSIGDTIEMSSAEGTFDTARIDMCRTLVLIAAGTGLTPMIRILNYATKQIDSEQNRDIFLLFFNKTQKDILCGAELQAMSEKYKFTFYNILSRSESDWTGETGYIRGELLHRLLPKPPSKTNVTNTLVCVCGPAPFSKQALDLLKEHGYNDSHLHLFLG